MKAAARRAASLVGETQQEGADLGPPPDGHDELGDDAERALAAGEVGEAERREAAFGEPGLGLVGATSRWPWPDDRAATSRRPSE